VRAWAKWVTAALAFAGAAVAVRLLAGRWLEPRAAVELVVSLGESAWALPAFSLAYLGGTTLLVPAVVFHVASGAAWGFGKALAVNLTLGNLVSNLQFWGGRLAGQARVRAALERHQLGWLSRELEGSGLWTMLVVRQLPIPFVLVNAAAGASPMPWWHFLVGSGLGLVPGALIYTYFAASLTAQLEGAREAVLLRAVAAGAGVVVLSISARLLQRYVTRRRVST
jgi:uncharacterized membrane protein YdjX (TVP38/TMEM64 family)